MKRIVCSILMLLLLCSAVKAEPLTAVDAADAAAALLVNTETGTVLFEKNADAPVDAAGLKRLPALLAVCRAFDDGIIAEETVVTVSAEAAGIRGTTAFIAPNERIAAGGLLKAAVMLTAGDAIYALLLSAYHDEYDALGAVNNLLCASGASPADNSLCEGREFTLRELMKISSELVKSPAFLRYSSVYTDTLPHENAKATELTNPNRLVRHYSGCFGLATGSVGASLYSAAVIARRGTTTFLALAAGLPDSSSRFRLVSDMLDAGFAAYRAVSVDESGRSFGSVSVRGGEPRKAEAVLGSGACLLLPVNDTRIVKEAVLPDELEAPIDEGAAIGRLIIKNSSGDILAEAPLIAAYEIKKASYKDEFLKLALNWIHAEDATKDRSG